MLSHRFAPAVLLIALSACDGAQQSNKTEVATEELFVPPDEAVPEDPVGAGNDISDVTAGEWPPVPGIAGGLPDDRTPISEAPFTPHSPQGAGQVLQRYALALEAKDYGEAYAAWGNGGKDSGMNASEFAKSWAKYRTIHGLVGAPSKTEGAAGSVDVKVPLQMYGALAGSGERFNLIGSVTLRRVAADGTTPSRTAWHITKSDLRPQL